MSNEDPEKPITLYINSPGGSVSAGLAIYDTMQVSERSECLFYCIPLPLYITSSNTIVTTQFIPCPVHTVCFGMAASMGSFLLGAGAKGQRRSLPNARIMIHQPLGGAQGQAADIEIQAKEILFTKAVINTYMADYTGQPVDKLADDTDRDFYMMPGEAKDYGLIDEVIKTKTSHISVGSMPVL